VSQAEASSKRDVMRAIRIGERVAARVVWQQLRQRLGLWSTFGVLLRVGWYKLRGQPFGSLAAPSNQRDRLSRRQCGDLILLDRAMRRVAGEDTAMAVARAAVLAAAVPFLDRMLPDADVAELSALGPKIAESFFNAEGDASMDGDSLCFNVRRCRFVELLQATDASHLGPLFCEADEVYFDGVRKPITLRRSRTLARGGDCCDFRFSPLADTSVTRPHEGSP
jgi:hypothetical protein